MQALWNGQAIADSERTLEVGGYVYFPRESVRMDLLRIAPKSDSDRACPHGVQFYDVGDGTAVGARAAWSYEAPLEKMKPIDRWIGFWGEVEIRDA